MKVNYSNTLTSICQHLGLLEGTPTVDVSTLEKAANWALNTQDTEGYQLTPYQPVALRPVLETLKGKEAKHFLPPLPLQLSNALFPVEEKEKPSNELLVKQFNTLKNALKSANEQHLLNVLSIHASQLAVNERYNDLSLFDFIKMTTGIALCLTQNTKLRLIAGSVSGIQTFLYDIISKNAAKLLKGRSFYVQLVTEGLLEKVLQNCGLSDCHVVYASGGNFFILMPDDDKTIKAFDEYAKTANEAIFKKHKFNLFLEMVKSDSFDTMTDLLTVWNEVLNKLNQAKLQRLSSNAQLFKDFFNPIELGGVRDKDPVTNEEINLETDKIKEWDDGIVVLDTTEQQKQLGRHLARAKYWTISQVDMGSNDDNYSIEDPFGNWHFFSKNDPKELAEGNFNSYRNINEIKIDEDWLFYGGNAYPLFEEDVKDIKTNKIIHRKHDAKPYEYLIGGKQLTRLGVLRMDVDGLGAIFSEQIAEIKTPQYKLNFVRYATASRSLDFFFKGYLNELQKTLGFTDSTVIIYSGGDDLFIVGKWNNLLELAQRINKDFAKWSCNNLHISGGIVLVDAKFPVMQGARLAEKAEKDAKKRKDKTNKTDADAFFLFDKAMKWQTEFDTVRKLYDEILPLLQKVSDTPSKYKLTRSFLTKVNVHAESQKAYRQGIIKSPVWRWQMAYDFARYRDTVKEEAKDFINQMIKDAFADTYKGEKIKGIYTYLELLQVAARWVELEIRTSEEL